MLCFCALLVLVELLTHSVVFVVSFFCQHCIASSILTVVFRNVPPCSLVATHSQLWEGAPSLVPSHHGQRTESPYQIHGGHQLLLTLLRVEGAARGAVVPPQAPPQVCRTLWASILAVWEMVSQRVPEFLKFNII